MGELAVTDRRDAQPRHTPGQNTLYSEAMTEAICAHLRRGATRRAAALAAGISYQTFYNWINLPETYESWTFFDAIARAEAEGELAFTESVAKAALGTNHIPGDYKASIELMKRRYPAWRDTIDIKRMDTEQLAELLRMASQGQEEAITEDGTPSLLPGDTAI